MARALWKGRIQFADVSLPVKLYTAVRTQRVRFHMLHDQDEMRLRQEMVCPQQNEAVPPEHRIKAFEFEKDQYVPVTPEELRILEPEPSRDIVVSGFVPVGSVDPRYIDHAYALGPDGAEGAFSVLHSALGQTASAGICSWAMRRRSYYGALIAGDILLLCVLRAGDEVIPVADLKLAQTAVGERELKTAYYLVDTLAGDFQPDQFSDTYEEQLMSLIAAKARGETVPTGKPEETPATPEKDLLAMLEASVVAAETESKKRRAQPAHK